MLKNESKLWNLLNNFNISKFSFYIEENEIELTEISDGKKDVIKPGSITFRLNAEIQDYLRYSPFFANFTLDINRAVALYSEVIKIEKPQDFFKTKTISIFQTIHLLLITGLEVYLRRLFKWMTNNVFIEDLEERSYKKFIKAYNLKVSPEQGKFSEILPKYLFFYRKEQCRSSFELIGYDVTNISNSIWGKIYGKNGYIYGRNLIVHSDISKYINEYLGIANARNLNLNKEIEKVENMILDIVKFVFYIEHQRFFKYPYEEEINSGFLDNFNYKNLNPLIKEIVIKQNFNDFISVAYEHSKREEYSQAIDILEILSQFQPNIIEIWYNLGMIYDKLNKPKKSQLSYQKAYDLDPNYKDLKEKISK